MSNLPPTELPYISSQTIDQLSTIDALKFMISDQYVALKAIENEIKNIEVLVNFLYEHFSSRQKGRLIYSGAGTSGRIGVQDGVELYPTFGWPKNKVDFIIAGGLRALTESIEGSEDGTKNLPDTINTLNINQDDIVIGITASGNTPYTCKVLEILYHKNIKTVGITNNPKGKILDFSFIKIILNTNQEVVAGSTRLKAGTAQKICLNLISTLLMTKLGFVKKGLMSNLVPTNKKLVKRKEYILKKLQN